MGKVNSNEGKEMASIENQTTEEIREQIEALQAIQKSCHWTAPKWGVASELLAPLFTEMAKRQQAGTL